MINFCTLFNANYLSRGIAMYQSLEEHCPNFHLYVFAFDDKTYQFLKSQNYKHLTPISLNDFEDKELLSVKATRSAAEYCWTCTPSTILYAIKKFGLDNCTYVDADMLFYNNPKVLIDEMGSKSVLITEHRYTAAYNQVGTSGKYCVQFVTAKNDSNGMKIMEWWRSACIEWCYARHEDGKFGDQKYLDDWTTRFEGVHVLKHLGGGLAPWNIQQYTFSKKDKTFTGAEIGTKKQFEPIFFHFHGLKFYEEDMVSLTDEGYEISKSVIDYFYKDYVRKLNAIKKGIQKVDNSFNPNGSSGVSPYPEMGFSAIKKYYSHGLRSSKINIFGQGLMKRIKQHYYYKVRNF